VTGVTSVGKELWPGTWEEGKSDLRRVDLQSAEAGANRDAARRWRIGPLNPNGGDLLFCGGGTSGMVKGVQKPKRKSKAVLAQWILQHEAFVEVICRPNIKSCMSGAGGPAAMFSE
jgi:hypothetical protein